jgi:rhodanese-related sulfurtransferase
VKNHSPGFLAIVEDAKSRVREETAQEALDRIAAHPAAVLVDVREESEYRDSHVKGAIALGKGIIERDIESLYPDKETELHLYCGGGFRSALTADNLQKMGYLKVISIDGGIRALKDAGASMVSGEHKGQAE